MFDLLPSISVASMIIFLGSSVLMFTMWYPMSAMIFFACCSVCDEYKSGFFLMVSTEVLFVYLFSVSALIFGFFLLFFFCLVGVSGVLAVWCALVEMCALLSVAGSAALCSICCLRGDDASAVFVGVMILPLEDRVMRVIAFDMFALNSVDLVYLLRIGSYWGGIRED